MAIIFLNDIQFSSRSDIVNGSLLTPPESVYLGPVENGSPTSGSGAPVNTGAGNDQLCGKMNDDSTAYNIIFPGSIAGVLLKGSLDLGAGNDGLKGEAHTNSGKQAVCGINLALSGEINAGAGNDKVEGIAHSASISSTQVVGIVISSTDGSRSIDMGSGGPGASKKGNDTVIGIASGKARSEKTDFDPVMAGIFLAAADSSIKTHEGNDTVTGIANAEGESPFYLFGILLNPSTKIETGAGNDKVTARATLNGATVNGFRGAGGGTVDLGEDNDVLEGFGDIRAKGGSGKDTWDLSAYNRNDFTIVKSGADGATFTKSGVTATADGFEAFIFADGAFNYASL